MKSTTSQDFDFLKLRKAYGLTQSDLGNLLKVSKNYICQIETGRKVPSDTLIALAQRIERELAEASASSRDVPLSSSQASRNAAMAYLDQVWAAAGDDKDLQGYITTKLRLSFPLDKPPFAQVEHHHG
jgi:transcriptional regulator with XRE-family HTH domain